MCSCYMWWLQCSRAARDVAVPGRSARGCGQRCITPAGCPACAPSSWAQCGGCWIRCGGPTAPPGRTAQGRRAGGRREEGGSGQVRPLFVRSAFLCSGSAGPLPAIPATAASLPRITALASIPTQELAAEAAASRMAHLSPPLLALEDVHHHAARIHHHPLRVVLRWARRQLHACGAGPSDRRADRLEALAAPTHGPIQQAAWLAG